MFHIKMVKLKITKRNLRIFFDDIFLWIKKISNAFFLFLDGRKVYAFCLAVIIGIPVIHFYYRPLSIEFIIFMECLFGYFFLNRSAQAKIHGHKLDNFLMGR